ncbi:hypothetical protein [Marinomonas primoryensis]|uniref:Uncharacterized protein n=1 Tax=Marinomonas primoryensis TaxID=178399 RepID=A0A859CYX8_9GAMM|nr:hypothetical protein [Marinomonas primoryensis]QKK79569.1 uncharacterized protein MP3633_0833 [Marinomonas primoryensis]
MNLVLLRNRHHLGAQITTFPVLAYFCQNHCHQEPLTLSPKSYVAWIYNQLPWVKECIDSNSKFEELKALKSTRPLSLNVSLPYTEWFLTHPKSVKVLPQKGHDIKTITTKSVTEYAVNLLKSQA